MTKYQYHPLSEIFPLLEGPTFDEFVAAIQTNGQRETIKLYQGKVLDGRNRERACTKLGLEPRVENATVETAVGSGVWRDVVDYDEALDFVMDANMKRRHLTVAERAFAAARWANIKQGAPKGNKRASKTEISRDISVLDKSSTGSREIRDGAKIFEVSPASANRARSVIKNAPNAPELEKDIKAGKVSLKAAADRVTPKRGSGGSAKKTNKGQSPSARAAAAQAVRERGREVTRAVGRMNRGLRMEDIDPELAKDPRAFFTKYGFVPTKTKDELAFDTSVKRADAFMVWMGEQPDVSVEDLFNWISYGKNAKEVAYKRGKLRDRLAGVLAELSALDRRLTDPLVVEAAE